MKQELPNTDAVPGVVIDHIAASTRQYIGSPSLAVLCDGTSEFLISGFAHL